ncbi:hypothetical protein [Lacrimispora sphenoides]|nr:hypothetical protein [Lacrimispora sphenoides]
MSLLVILLISAVGRLGSGHILWWRRRGIASGIAAYSFVWD